MLAILPLLGVQPALAQDTAPSPAISLITFGPGETYWERFGHDAILVGDPADPDARLYNYGMFDFHQKNFFLNFARGRMNYRVAEQPFYDALRFYASERRWVYLQQLDLDAEQRRGLAAYLQWNVQPENAEYRYDYFVSNCATRVRDALDKASGGAIARASRGVASGRTYRFEATRLIAPVAPLSLLMDLGMGPRADVPIDRWQQSFVPMVLKDVVQDAQLVNADGSTRPLVAHATWVLRSDAWPEPARPPAWTLPLTVLGLAFAALLLLLDRLRRQRAARWSFALLAFATSVKAALGGLVLLAGWTLTEHWALWANRNLLLFDPLCLLLLPAWLMSARVGWQPRAWQRLLAVVIALLATVSLPLLLLPGAQQNLPWIGAMLPGQLALAWAMLRMPQRLP
ncbi:Lnb N-terminal periplasmic domain-containing protein [Solimonas terrae]|uniref:DUF4105 domain-containing protein n=1 Tax=Solimonas terrae TaxID=1396819 RepID=A0A6M2BVF2_9GAMM|nr:DUF4105 domain-containing protein [Solimonas terrae]NGY05969.1 DUF4105 domain-containing protein [Solimonas terrae]